MIKNKLYQKMFIILTIIVSFLLIMPNNFTVYEYLINIKTNKSTGNLITLYYQNTDDSYIYSEEGIVDLNNEVNLKFQSSKKIRIVDVFSYKNDLDLNIFYNAKQGTTLEFNSQNIKNVILYGYKKIKLINIVVDLIIITSLYYVFFLLFKKTVYLTNLIAFLVVFILCFALLLEKYIASYFSTYTWEEIIFFISTPIVGADKKDIINFIKQCIILPFFISTIVVFLPEILHFIYYRIIRNIRKNYKIYIILYVCCLSAINIGYIFYENKLWQKFFPKSGTFYEEYYVPSTKKIIKEPKKKQNLILLQIESFEKSFDNKSVYGESLISGLRDYEKKGIVFSDYNNGFGSASTQQSLIAVFTGLPSTKLNTEIINRNGQYKIPFAKIYSLGDILQDAGYSSFSIRGSSGVFSGTNRFLENHGVTRNIDKKVLDLLFITNSRSQNNWGYYDEDIYKVSQNILTNAKNPFFLFIQTIDTHGGMFREDVENKFDNHYYNTIHNTTQKTADFIKWIQKQDFAKDTTIIIYGDHLRHGNDIIYPQQRSIYNLFINPVKIPNNTERHFTQVDLFPTILEAIGFDVKGHRLGIGTSVFSDRATLIETYDEEYLKKQLSQKNHLYDSLQ